MTHYLKLLNRFATQLSDHNYIMQGSQIQIDKYFYDKHDFKGSGSFGQVYKGKNIQTGEVVAIKVLDMTLFHDQFMIDSLRNEIHVMKELKSENVVRILDVFKNSNQTYMVIEYCPEGDLRKFISHHGGLLNENLAQEVLRQLMRGFQDLITHNYIHRDIKPENALVKGKTHKVADFGFATKVDITGRQLLKDWVGTPLYMSPQLLSQQPYTAKSDIWSIGMLYFEMLFGKTPWPARDQRSFLLNIRTQPLKFPYDKPISTNSKDFIQKCLQISEEKRIGWDMIFQHPLLKESVQQNQPQQFQVDKQSKDLLKKLQYVVQKHNLEINQIFQKFDGDKNNQLDLQEFLQLLRAIDPNIQNSRGQVLFKSLLKQGHQNLHFEEFRTLFCETDFCDLNDKAGHVITDLKEIIKAHNIQLNQIFKNFDKDKQGLLDFQEFLQMIKVIAPAIKENECMQVFNKFDHNKDGSISFDEFRMVLGDGVEKSAQNPAIQKAKIIRDQMRQKIQDKEKFFSQFDTSHDRELDQKECFRMFRTINPNLSESEYRIVFRLFDEDHNGSISLNEFRQQMSSATH